MFRIALYVLALLGLMFLWTTPASASDFVEVQTGLGSRMFLQINQPTAFVQFDGALLRVNRSALLLDSPSDTVVLAGRRIRIIRPRPVIIRPATIVIIR